MHKRLLALVAQSRKTWLGATPDHSVPGAIGYDETWRLFVNLSREELRESAGVGQRKALKKDD